MSDAPTWDGFEHGHVDVNGVRLHYVEGGTSVIGEPPLVLLHGWPQHHGIWRDVAPDLARDHHVVAVDLRGHGWSEVPEPEGDAYDKRTLAADVEALVVELELDRPVLVGHDWGAYVSLLVAARHPELVRGVVALAIVAPWTSVPVSALPRLVYQVVAAGPWGRLAHQGLGQRFLRTVFSLGAGRGPRLDDIETYLERYRDRGRALAGVAMYRRFLARELPQSLRRTYTTVADEVPLAYLPGRDDAVLTPEIVAASGRLPNATLEVVEGAGHWVPEQRPDAVVAAVRDFLATRL